MKKTDKRNKPGPRTSDKSPQPMVDGLSPFPLEVPDRLIEAFRHYRVNPVLSGGGAVQVWTGCSDGLFATGDLDFVTSLNVRDIREFGAELDGRYAVLEGVVIEFPSADLGVGDLYLDPILDSRVASTKSGAEIRVIRPEACVLDRLTQVVFASVAEAYLQAFAVAMSQSSMPGWVSSWIDDAARKANLGKIWEFLRSELKRSRPSEDTVEMALKIGPGN